MSKELTPEAVPNAVRREYVEALRACRLAERRFVAALPAERWRPFAAGAALKISRSNIQKMLGRGRVQRAIRAADVMSVELLGITTTRIIGEYAALAFSRVGDFFDARGTILPPSQWTEEMHGAVMSLEVEELFAGKGEDRYPIGVVRKLKLHPKRDAIDALARMKRLAVDRGGMPEDEGEDDQTAQVSDAELARRLYHVLKRAQSRTPAIDGECMPSQPEQPDAAQPAPAETLSSTTREHGHEPPRVLTKRPS
jgi:phage terminase small subunit